MIKKISIAENKKIIIQSLKPLADGGVSTYIINKIASTGTTYDKLKQIYKDSSVEGLTLCLSKSTSTAQGKIKPVVTASKSMISTIIAIIPNDISQEIDEANDMENLICQSDTDCDSDSD